MTATEQNLTALTAQIGDLAVSMPFGERTEFAIVAATDEKIALADPSALNYRYQPTRKWYKRNSKILARFTFEAGA